MAARWLTGGMAATLLALAPAPVLAASPVDAVLACQAQADAQARLACFDRTVPGLKAVPAAVAAAPAAPDPQRFGLPERRRDPDAQPLSVTGIVKAVRETEPNRFVVTLDNGQVWRVKADRRPRLGVGDKVEVREAAMGSFAMVPEKSPTFLRAERVQ